MDVVKDESTLNCTPQTRKRFQKTRRKRLFISYYLLRMRLRRLWSRLRCTIDITTCRKLVTLLQFKFTKIPTENASDRFDAGTNTEPAPQIPDYRRPTTVYRVNLSASHENRVRSRNLVSEADDEESELEPGEIPEPDNYHRVRFKRGRDTRRRSQQVMRNYRDGSRRKRKRRSSLTRSRSSVDNSPSPSDDESVKSFASGDKRISQLQRQRNPKKDSPSETEKLTPPHTDEEEKPTVSTAKQDIPSRVEAACQTIRVEVSCQTDAPEENTNADEKEIVEEQITPPPPPPPSTEIPSYPIPPPPNPVKSAEFKKSFMDRIIALGTRRRKHVPDNMPKIGVHIIPIPPEHADGWKRKEKNSIPKNSILQFISKPKPHEETNFQPQTQFSPINNVWTPGIVDMNNYRSSLRNYNFPESGPGNNTYPPIYTPSTRPYSFDSSNLSLPAISDRSALSTPATLPISLPTIGDRSALSTIAGEASTNLPAISSRGILPTPSALPISLPAINDRSALPAKVDLVPASTVANLSLGSKLGNLDEKYGLTNSVTTVGIGFPGVGTRNENGDQLYVPQSQFTSKYYNLLNTSF